MNKKHTKLTFGLFASIWCMQLCLLPSAHADETDGVQYMAPPTDRYWLNNRVYQVSLASGAIGDGFTGQVVIMTRQKSRVNNSSLSAAFCRNGRITDWWIRQDFAIPFNEQRVVTPVLVERIPDPADTTGINPFHWRLRGIGTGRLAQPGSSEARMYSFGLTSGSDFVRGDGNWFFGWYDGDLIGNPNNDDNVLPTDHSGSIPYQEFQQSGFQVLSFGNGWFFSGRLRVGEDLLDRQRESLAGGSGTLPGFGTYEREYSTIALYQALDLLPSLITSFMPTELGGTSTLDFENSTSDGFNFGLEMANQLEGTPTWLPVPGALLNQTAVNNLQYTFPSLSSSSGVFRVQTTLGPIVQ